MKKFTVTLVVLLGLILIAVWPANAVNIPIDLRDFNADPTVSIASDGFSAKMLEDGSPSAPYPILLSNDPFFGAPGITVPDYLLTLSFNYTFSIGAGNTDNFYAYVFDGDPFGSGTILRDLDIFASGAGIFEGTVRWDLSAIDPSITILGLEFQLGSFDSLIDSSLIISNVYLKTAPSPVPEPATIILVAMGLFGFLGLGRRKILNKG